MAECPRCDEPLNLGATACRCGWKARAKRDPKSEQPRERVHCAHETCETPAICRVKTVTGWANFCEPHYVMHHDTISRKRCTELGLDQRIDETKADWRRRLLAWVRACAKPKRFEDAVMLEDQWAKGEEAA